MIFIQDQQDYFYFFNRRRAQTFLPADPAGKKYVNRYAINVNLGA
jgi:hypothetical protein